MDKTKIALPVTMFRWFIACLAPPGCFLFGFWLADAISGVGDLHPYLTKGVPALGLGMMVGILRTVMTDLAQILTFVRSGKMNDLWTPGASFLCIGLTIAFGMNLVDRTVGPSTDGLGGVTSDAPAAVQPYTGDAHAVIPVYFIQEAGGYDPATKTFATGTSIDSSGKRMIRTLVRGLSKCSGGAPVDVELSVRGFASSSDYAGKSQAETDALNLRIADARADAVIQVIQNEISDDSGVVIQKKSWASMREMASTQVIDDAPAGGYNPDLGLLNRRADILLMNPGGCRVRGDFPGWPDSRSLPGGRK